MGHDGATSEYAIMATITSNDRLLWRIHNFLHFFQGESGSIAIRKLYDIFILCNRQYNVRYRCCDFRIFDNKVNNK